MHPSAMATENDVVVQTEEELLVAVENHVSFVIIDGYIPLSQSIELRHHLTMHGQGVISVSDHHRHFEIWDRSQLVIDGDITLTRAEGYEGLGGGIRVVNGTLMMKSGYIYNNEMIRGGGILITQGQVYMYGGTIKQNRADIGGGVYIGGWDAWDVIMFDFSSMLTMRGGEITNNVAAFTGGGLYSTIGIIYLEHGVIANNRASGSGGVFISDVSQYYISSEMRFEGNYPINRHDIESSFPLVEFLLTPTAFHIVALFAIIGIGVLWARVRKSGYE